MRRRDLLVLPVLSFLLGAAFAQQRRPSRQAVQHTGSGRCSPSEWTWAAPFTLNEKGDQRVIDCIRRSAPNQKAVELQCEVDASGRIRTAVPVTDDPKLRECIEATLVGVCASDAPRPLCPRRFPMNWHEGPPPSAEDADVIKAKLNPLRPAVRRCVASATRTTVWIRAHVAGGKLVSATVAADPVRAATIVPCVESLIHGIDFQGVQDITFDYPYQF